MKISKVDYPTEYKDRKKGRMEAGNWALAIGEVQKKEARWLRSTCD